MNGDLLSETTPLALPVYLLALSGTGAQDVHLDVCMGTMVAFLGRMFPRGLTPAREARIVHFT